MLCFKNIQPTQGLVLDSFQRYWMLFLKQFLPHCCVTGHFNVDLRPVNNWWEITQLLRKPHPWRKAVSWMSIILAFKYVLNSFETQHFSLSFTPPHTPLQKQSLQYGIAKQIFLLLLLFLFKLWITPPIRAVIIFWMCLHCFEGLW